MRLSAMGIKEYVARIPARNAAGYSKYASVPSSVQAWDVTMEVFPHFVSEFANHWKQS